MATMKQVKHFASDLIYFPSLNRGVFCLWRRNFLYFRYTLFTTMAWIFLEPLLYLFALGFGLGRFIPEIEGMKYAEFIAPAMIGTSGMFVAFFEGTYGTYTKLSRQNTYQTIILTPISPDEVALGEIVWVTSKAFFSVISVSIVMALMGLIAWAKLPGILFVFLLMCWVFAAFGILFATYAKSYEWFSYSQSGFITPMSLFCGTYFPLSQLPDWLQYITYSLPLTHGMMAVRTIISGSLNSSVVLNVAYLAFAALFLTNLAAANMGRKLIS